MIMITDFEWGFITATVLIGGAHWFLTWWNRPRRAPVRIPPARFWKPRRET